MMTIARTQHMLREGHQAVVRRCHVSKGTSKKTEPTWLQVYCFVFGGIGAAFAANESFWFGIKRSEGNRKRLIALPIITVLGMARGAVAGVASVPLIIAIVAWEKFQKAYQVRKESW